MTVIRLIGLATGEPSEFDDSYVVRYDPACLRPDGVYDGGVLEVTRDRAKARHFASIPEAAEYWRQSYGIRPDGLPNRPLTAWTVSLEAGVDGKGRHG